MDNEKTQIVAVVIFHCMMNEQWNDTLFGISFMFLILIHKL
jgi:hypothetical protein